MAWSSVFLAVVLLSAFPGPSVGGYPMPKLADWKLCADEECSRKSWGLGALGAWMASLWKGAATPFCSFPRPHLHGRGPSGLRGPRLPFPDYTPGPSRVQGDYYGDVAARLGYFPSSIVREDQTLKPGKTDVKTDKWDFYCQ
nr:melanoma-derived growth regulatory protein isoform X1 [Kogia breviceps]